MYRIFVIHNGTERELLDPLGKVSLTRKKVSNDFGGFYWTRELSDITVSRRYDLAAYNFLLQIEDGANRCMAAQIRVDRYENKVFDHTRFVGEFSMNQCRFNLENCTISIGNLKETSIYSCLDKKKDVDFNIMNVENPISPIIYNPQPGLNTFEGNLMYQVGQLEYVVLENATAPVGPEWTLITTDVIEGATVRIWARWYAITACIAGVPQIPIVDFFGQQELPWVQVGTCTGPDTGEQSCKWVLVVGPEVISILTMELTITIICPWPNAVLQFTDAEAAIPGADGTCYTLGINVVNAYVTSIPNGRKLSDVLLALVTRNSADCDSPIIGIRSDFFQINPPSGSATNNYVTGTYNYWKDPLLFQITDLKWPDANTSASVAIITFKKLMADLYRGFKVVWWIELDAGSYYLRIEHISQAESDSAYDLTEKKGFKKYSYDQELLSYSLRFKSLVQRNMDFVGTEITFVEACTNKETSEITMDMLCADVPFIRGFPDNCPNDGIVIVSWNGVNRIWNVSGKLSGAMIPNAAMSWANLHDAFHGYNAHTPTGTINGAVVTFASTIRNKIQEVIVQDCDIAIDDFTKVETELGIGIIESITTTLLTESNKIDVKL